MALAGLLTGVLLALHPVLPAEGVEDSPTAASAPALWLWPIDPPHILERGYSAPATRYGAGHRGIDVASAAGAVVRAPADGTVAFAGPVGGRPVLAIRHARGLVSSFEPVTPLVDDGDAVAAGQPVGTVSSDGAHCPGCLHVGARQGGEYLSPLALLGGVPRAVLLPLDD